MKVLVFMQLPLFLLVSCKRPTIENKNSFQLFKLSQENFISKKTALAGAYLIASSLRYEIDKKIFPPKKSGGDSPGTALAALTHTSFDLRKKLAENDQIFRSALETLETFTFETTAEYEPGWEYTERDNSKDQRILIENIVDRFIISSKLLRLNPAYQNALKTIEETAWIKYSDNKDPEILSKLKKAERLVKTLQEKAGIK